MQNSGIASVAPASFSEMYREYHDYVQTLVRKFGIDQGNVEDVTSIIMMKAFEKGLVDQYDATQVSTHTGRSVPFKSLLYGFVSAYVQHHRDRQQIVKRRDAYYIGTTDAETSWLAERGELHIDSFEELFEDDLIRQIRIRCLAAPAHSADAVRLSTLFDFAMMQVEETGSVNQGELAELFGTSRTTISRTFRKLRAIVDQVMAES